MSELIWRVEFFNLNSQIAIIYAFPHSTEFFHLLADDSNFHFNPSLDVALFRIKYDDEREHFCVSAIKI